MSARPDHCRVFGQSRHQSALLRLSSEITLPTICTPACRCGDGYRVACGVPIGSHRTDGTVPLPGFVRQSVLGRWRVRWNLPHSTVAGRQGDVQTSRGSGHRGGGRLTNLELTRPSRLSKEFDPLIDEVLTYQHTDVDNITGATWTGAAMLRAIDVALSGARR